MRSVVDVARDAVGRVGRHAVRRRLGRDRDSIPRPAAAGQRKTVGSEGAGRVEARASVATVAAIFSGRSSLASRPETGFVPMLFVL